MGNDQPIKSLLSFERVNFRKGESKSVELKIPSARLRHYNGLINDYSIAPGTYEFQIGASSEDIRLKTNILIQ